MKKYNWIIDTLINRLKLIERLIASENNPAKLEILLKDQEMLQDDIHEFFHPPCPETFKLLEKYAEIKEDFMPLSFIWEDIQDFYTIVELIAIPEIKNCSLSKKDILGITHDFYKSLNPFFYKYFMASFENYYKHIVFRSADEKRKYIGEIIPITSLSESFIRIVRDYTLDDVFTTIHEYSHAISDLINPNHSPYYKGIFYEIDTIFMELIAKDYLQSMFKDKPTIISAYHFNNFCFFADYTKTQIDLIKVEETLPNGYTNNKVLKQVAFTECYLDSGDLEDVLYNYNDTDIIYLVSFIFAIELYEMYKEDKDKALYYLRRIIELPKMKEHAYYKRLLKMGLIPNHSLELFQNELKQDVMNLTLKKPKSKH